MRNGTIHVMSQNEQNGQHKMKNRIRATCVWHLLLGLIKNLFDDNL
jgi:hypothetical protein